MEEVLVPTVVIDIGSGFCKAGIAGDEYPRCVFPTIVGRDPTNKRAYAGKEALAKRDILSLNRPIKRGVIDNWTDLELLLQHTFYNELRVAPEEHPILLADGLNPKESRERLTQIICETFAVPAVYISMQSVLSLHASGRPDSGVVLDSGYDATYVVPIYEGYPLPHSIKRLNFGGCDLDKYLNKVLSATGYSLPMDTVCDIKQKVGCVALDFEKDIEVLPFSATAKKDYVLPDGKVITLDRERLMCTEPLFRPELCGIEEYGIHEAVYNSIMKGDNDIRHLLYGNIVLSGGTTLFPGIAPRLEKELTALAPPNFRVNVKSPPERNYSAWIGGSMLSCSPNFCTMWISKQEYDEFGPRIVHKKCLA